MERKTINIYNYSRIDYLLILLFLFSSGSIIWFYKLTPAISHCFYLFISTIVFFSKKKKLKYYNSFPIIFSLLISLNVFFFNTDTINRTGIGNIVAALGSYIFFQLYDFYKFRFLYLKTLSILTAVGIVVFILTEFDILPITTYTDDSGNMHEMFLIYHVGWSSHFHRLAGIWHEPGACMIFLIVALLLYIPELKSFHLNKMEKKYILIIILGILCTQSTTGYIAFMIIIGYCAFANNSVSKGKKILLMAFCVGAIITIYNSGIVQDKLNQDEDARTSKGIRMRDNLACLQMALDNPFTGVGFGTKKFKKISEQLDNESNSNGLLLICAYMGIYFILLFWLYAYQNIRRWHVKKIDALIIIIVLTIIESNEAFVEFPVTFIFLARFYSYNKHLLEFKQNNQHQLQ